MEEPEELTFQFIREITDGLSEKRKIGEGAFGEVYRGTTKNGNDVAVKKLRDGSTDLGYKQFQNEFYNLAKVKHENIVEVLGYCYEIEKIPIEYNGRKVFAERIHRALCFEYFHNGSLQNHLSDESRGLDWHIRYKIIKGTCEGLKYIHKDLEEPLLHLDLKPDNILVDKNMVPKIADFGLSRIFGEEIARTTQSPLGTIGFIPPEFIERGEISEKFDIFSLGILIIRIISGPNGYSKYRNMPLSKIIDEVQGNWRKRWQATCISDFSLETCCRQVEKCTQIAWGCLEEDSQKRPDIVQIIDKLNEIDSYSYKETRILQPPEKERKVTANQHQHSDFMIGSGSNETESDNAQETLRDVEEQATIVGRDEEKNKIVTSLLKIIQSEEIVILPIYGIGGIGKTTFAELIYSDKDFKCYSHVWVHVSRRFDLEKIGKSIHSQLKQTENQSNEYLKSKGILIVLDDIWEDKPFKLEELMVMLNLGDNMKKVVVLVTTRNADIAQKICKNIEPYQMGILTDEMCWDIIKQKSCFEAKHDREKLVDIGKKIAQKCRGVALAALTLGSMLRTKDHADEWLTIKDNDMWNQTISKDTSLPQHVLASLKLSYAFSMDDDLKRCFSYCAIFPKGHKIVKDDLIYQWISLGFVMPNKILSTFERCEKYIVHLLRLSFLQHSVSPTTYRAYGEYDTAFTYGEYDTVFTMHDLVHDLAIALLGDQILDESKQGNTGGSSCCYALLSDCSRPLESCTTCPGRLLALRFLDCWRTELYGAAFEPAESLQVLDLSECSIQKLPDSIGVLKQLRYFNAPRIRDCMVPQCIAKLSNLSYLSLRESCSIQALPESIGDMQGLVHLDLSGCIGIEKLPESFGNLRSLEHLDFTNCKNVTGVSQCLARFTKLQYLNLSNCKKVGHIPRALGSLTELQYLNLSGSSYLSGNELAEAEFLGSLTKLNYLNLSSSKRLDIIRLPEALGGLTVLKYLNLSHHSSMRKLPASFGNLCNLVHLDLSWCSNLRDVPAALNGFTKLQYLDLGSCSSTHLMEGLEELFGSLSKLRHLNLHYSIERTILPYPDEINGFLERLFTLTNLEYLNLSSNGNIYSIPENLANLSKLQTLDLSYCLKLQRLPASILKIDSLKFLHTDGCSELDRSMLPQYNTNDGESSNYPFHCKYEFPDWLMIKGLENVKSAKEVQKMKLVEKAHITTLELEWTIDVRRYVDDAEVLRELEPPYSISMLYLKGYNSASFPPLVMQIGDYLTGLTKINMVDLPSCHHLPPLGQLPNLKNLSIIRMHSIKKIDMHLYGGARAFPRLKELSIVSMKCLEEWNTEDGLDEPRFPCLSSVDIKYCPSLRIKPHPPQSIVKLLVHSSDQVMLSSGRNRGQVLASAVTSLHVECCMVPLHHWSLLRHLPALESLTMVECSDITSSSPDFLRGLASLRTLTVKGAQNIVTMPKMLTLPERLGDLTALTELEISCCKGIKNRPGTVHKLTHLRTLSCKSMVSLPEWLGDLTSLRRLDIFNCGWIKTVPDSIQQLTRLQTLSVRQCQSILSLPECLGDITSLLNLKIIYCERLKTLPDSIQKLARLETLTVQDCKSIISLPERLGDLASLEQLMISGCKVIKTLPDSIRQLTCLQTLELQGCHSIVSLPEMLGDISTLTKLEIVYCKGIKALPGSIQQLTHLQTLTLNSCESMVSLPETLGNLISLSELEIGHCRGIKTLPSSIQQLTCLQRLEIYGCPELVRWCSSEENKMKLAHIQDRNFSQKLLSDDDSETDEESESEEEPLTDEESESEEEPETGSENDEESETDEQSENEDFESDQGET